MRIAALMMGLLLAPLAHGQQTARTMLRQALLTEALDGNYDQAVQHYQTLVRELPQGHPVRADALYRLGAARYALGDTRGAREALLEGIRSGLCRAPCYELLGEMELEAASIQALPVHWTFDDGDHALFHPWAYDDKGSIRVQSPDEAENPALIWSTEVDVRKGDQLVIGLRSMSPPPRTLSVRMQAVPNPAAIRIRVVDNHGHTYTHPGGVFRIPTDRPTTLDITLTELQSDDPQAPPLDPANLHRVYLEDFSAFNGTIPGENQLYLDDLRITE